ncbi:unnamed protein product [Diatraea saccharalis]|uniref:Cytochrome c oxidase assembly protein COX15 homolog n=1 Tax=Diatraea saccharalis TaxID=40085 RepID=A0A9N9R1L1_9NEOP|nr:unnamed protein product [Diatraea saccharalis]
MWSGFQLCRCKQPLKAAQNKLLACGTRYGLNSSNLLTRQLYTPLRNGHSNKLQSRISELLKSNKIFVRLNSSTQKPASSKMVGYWLLGCSGMVFTAVVLGGVTRLTESGLSMVTWKLLGEKLPRTEEQWQEEFEKYKQYPEFKYKNHSMSLSEFKWIWWMEYAHRTWGRAIGLCVLGPAAALALAGRLPAAMRPRVAVYCALVAAQGLMGWYMVKSGLEDRFEGPADVPRVSQYRLAAHLSLALLLYAGLLAGALRLLRPPPAPAALAAPTPALPRGLRSIFALAHAVKAMVFFTAVSGAFVAGLDAGLVYNSFPKMGDRWVPEEVLALRPAARNLTENPATTQLQHRALGVATLAAATAAAAHAVTRRAPLPPAARRLAVAVGALAWLQVSLGVGTLLCYVPTWLAAAHQANSLALLGAAVCLTHEVKLLRYIPK